MKRRALFALLVMSTLTGPALTTNAGAAQTYTRRERALPRSYDSEHKDYHVWNDVEQRAYHAWLETKHFTYRQYSRLRTAERREYWRWRHEHSNDYDRH